MTLTAEHRIKRHLLLEFLEATTEDDFERDCPMSTASQIEDRWNSFVASNMHWDYMEDFRCSGAETNIEHEWDRNYESKSVAAELSDGSWVGWTYWFGGGKHGDPESIPWMEEAYMVNMVEEVRTVQVFSKAE